MHRPSRGWILTAVLAVVVLALAGGYVAWDQFLRGDEVAPLALSTPSPAASVGAGASSAGPSSGPPGTADPAGTSPAGAASPAAAAGSSGPGSAADLAGTWTIGEGSVAGYRVREKLASLPAQSDAVGRTSDITGQVSITASGGSVAVSAAHFEVDLTTLSSDKPQRDRRLTEMGIESSRFPTATFELSSPVEVPAAALSGGTVDVTLTGQLTLHGVTKAVEIPAQARLTNGQIEVVGSLTFPFADFSIQPPNIGGFVTVEDQGTLEFQVFLVRG